MLGLGVWFWLLRVCWFGCTLRGLGLMVFFGFGFVGFGFSGLFDLCLLGVGG